MIYLRTSITLLVLAGLFAAGAYADYLVVVTGPDDVIRSVGRSDSPSANPTGITTGGGYTVYWLQDGQSPDDLLTAGRTPRYTYTPGGGWVVRTNGSINADDAQRQGRKQTPSNNMCTAFTLPAGVTEMRLEPELPLPDATFMVHVMILSGPPTGYHYVTARDTGGCTMTWTTNSNTITGIATFVDCHE